MQKGLHFFRTTKNVGKNFAIYFLKPNISKEEINSKSMRMEKNAMSRGIEHPIAN